MTSIIYDTDAIGKAARLKALEGRSQNSVAQPMTVNTAPAEFDNYGMYLTAGSCETVTIRWERLPNIDTAPCEYWSSPEQDPA